MNVTSRGKRSCSANDFQTSTEVLIVENEPGKLIRRNLRLHAVDVIFSCLLILLHEQ